METKLKYGQIQVKASEAEDRIVNFVATDEIVDYDNEIVKVEGMDIEQYLKSNRSFLWSHMHSELPIGKVNEVKKYKNKIKAKAQMVSEDEYAFGYTVYKLIKGGYINNVSIGFMPNYDTITHEEKNGKRVSIINDSKLFEISAVNIGANPNAVITSTKQLRNSSRKAWDDGYINGTELNTIDDFIDSLLEELDKNKIQTQEIEKKDIDEVKDLEKTIEEAQKVINEDEKGSDDDGIKLEHNNETTVKCVKCGHDLECPKCKQEKDFYSWLFEKKETQKDDNEELASQIIEELGL